MRASVMRIVAVEPFLVDVPPREPVQRVPGGIGIIRGVRSFFAGLPPDAKAEAIALIRLAETLGNALREPRSKALGGGLLKLRRNQVRLFYVFEPGQCIRRLGGMVKRQDRIPADVLAQMRDYQKDARERVKKAKTEKKR